MVELRTYKTGLRAPSTLLNGITGLVRERQVLRFLEKDKNVKFDSFLESCSGLSNAPGDVKEDYHEVFKRWEGCSASKIKDGLGVNLAKLDGFKERNQLYFTTFNRKDISAISNTATPDPALISLHDYCYLAGESFKMTCATINTIAMEAIDAIPESWADVVTGALANIERNGNDIKEGSLYKYPEKAIAHFLGKHGNIELTAFEQVATMMQVHEDTCEKVDDVRRLLFSTGHDFYNADLSFLYTYSVPRVLLHYLAKKWSVERNWVRNILVGWRRKIDALLPVKCQVEPLVELFSRLADHARNFVKSEEQLKLVGILERKRLLHFLPKDSGVDLESILDVKYLKAYHALQDEITSWTGALHAMIERHCTRFSEKLLLESARILEDSVKERLAGCKPDSNLASSCKWFLKNLTAIIDMFDAKTLPLFQQYLPGNKYTGSVARLLSSWMDGKENGSTNLFTVVRGIVTLAFASLHAKATAQLERALVPVNCVTRPYMSSKRKKKHLPVNLLFNKYVVERKTHPSSKKYLNNKEATKLLVQGRPFWLGIPVYSPGQLDANTRKIKGIKKGTFWFQLVPTKPIIKRLQRRARLESIRLNVPSGPTRKIVADVILSADDPKVFARSSNFIKTMDDKFGKKYFPKARYISNDLNKLGKHAIAIGSAKERISLLGGKNVMESITQKADRIGKAWAEIGSIQSALARDDISLEKKRRQEVQITLLHRRIRRLHVEAEREIIMIYLYTTYRTGASQVGWDSVSVETRGTRGTLAKSITYMPKRKDLMDVFEEWARDLLNANMLSRFKEVIPVTPFTSQACDECFSRTGKQARTRTKGIGYHEFKCTTPGCPHHDNPANRHEVSARVSALVLKQLVEKGNSLIT